jgi:hypothetical protein
MLYLRCKISKINKIKVMTIEKSTKRGRPIVAGSKRQDRVAAKQLKVSAGIEIKRGRPKGSTKEAIEEAKKN